MRLKLDTPKDFYQELDRVEKEGYDKSRFCCAECVLIHVCDHCFFYDFKPGDCGCYLDAGQCELHGHKDPEEGNGCPDYVCRALKKAPQWRIDNYSRIITKLQEAKDGINICKDCWANIFCSAAQVGDEDVRENPN